MADEINSKIIKEYGLDAGASVVGIANSKDFELAPKGFKPTDRLEGCLSVIVLGAPFPQEAMDKNSVEYTNIRNELLEKMDEVAENVAKRIKNDGYKTQVIGGESGRYVKGRGFHGLISLKHAAEFAGLGVINRNDLLTNSQYGNLLWFSAVLTDANLLPDKKVQYTLCNNCNKCVEICPSGALDNPSLFGQSECRKTAYKQVKGKLRIECFLCRKVCQSFDEKFAKFYSLLVLVC
ncbi:MAG: 4Fe-4S binding protein [Methanobrevibacter sp.]|nr:4Fe-4S binding protein [Methanobrevibacter sp.]